MAKTDKNEKKEKKKRNADIDMETTFADMNVEGFKWYNPHKKKNSKDSIGKITFKEFWAMVVGAFLAFWPTLLMIIPGVGMMVAIAYMWLH